MANLKVDFIFNSFAQIIVIILGFLSNIIISRILGPYDKGVFSYILLIVGSISSFANFGIDLGNSYFTAKKKYTIEEVVVNSIFCITIGTMLGIIIVVISSIFNSNYKVTIISNLLIIILISTQFSILFFSGILRGIDKINYIAFSSVIGQLVNFTVTIMVWFLKILNVNSLLAINVLVNIITLIIISKQIKLRKKHKLKLIFNKKVFKTIVKYGFPGYIANLASYFNYRADMFLIAYFLNPIQLGLYSISVTLGEKIWILPQTLGNVLYSKALQKDLKEQTNFIIRIVILVMAVSCLLLYFFAHKIIVFLFGMQYAGAISSFRYLLLGIYSLCIPKILSSYLAALGKLGPSMTASIISMIVNIILNIILIPMMGISGASLASSVSYSFMAVYILISYKIESQSKFGDFLFKMNDLRILYNSVHRGEK